MQNNDYVECTSGCPVPTTLHPTINLNRMPGANYWDVGITYKVLERDGGSGADVYFKVDNLTNVQPPISSNPGGIVQISQGVNPTIYDVVGRMFHAGVRFKM